MYNYLRYFDVTKPSKVIRVKFRHSVWSARTLFLTKTRIQRLTKTKKLYSDAASGQNPHFYMTKQAHASSIWHKSVNERYLVMLYRLVLRAENSSRRKHYWKFKKWHHNHFVKTLWALPINWPAFYLWRYPSSANGNGKKKSMRKMSIWFQFIRRADLDNFQVQNVDFMGSVKTLGNGWAVTITVEIIRRENVCEGAVVFYKLILRVVKNRETHSWSWEVRNGAAAK